MAPSVVSSGESLQLLPKALIYPFPAPQGTLYVSNGFWPQEDLGVQSIRAERLPATEQNYQLPLPPNALRPLSPSGELPNTAPAFAVATKTVCE